MVESVDTHRIRSEAVARMCSIKRNFALEILRNSQKNTFAGVSFRIKSLFIKKRLSHRCFPMNFAEFLRIPFLKEHF